MERAEKRCERLLAVRADEVLDTRGALTHLWDGLVRVSAFPWWFDWPVHEAAAITLRSFQLSVVPGLLQTADYARALLHGDETAVAARLARQDILPGRSPRPRI